MISIVTPHYKGSNPYIGETYSSLLEQTFNDWEWVLVLNNGGEVSEEISSNPKVRIAVSPGENSKVGYLKRLACTEAKGEVIIELDSDDLLTPDALYEINLAFENNPSIPFVYSNDAEFQHGTFAPNCYSSYWGWQNRPYEYKGHKLLEQVGMPPTPHALRAIFWAPNHVRAWRTSDYWTIGGHNPEQNVVDDYDLCCRFYLHADMYHIDKCLYLYRRHGQNTTFTRNAEIQNGNSFLYNKYAIPMVETWAKRNNYPMIDLGGRVEKPAGYISFDKYDADVNCDLEEGIPFSDNTVGVVRAYDFLEHIHDPIQIMNEIYRVLVPGGWVLIAVPSTDGRGAFQDPTHVSFWNENSFWYYTNPRYAAYSKDIKCKFQESRVLTKYPSPFHQEHEISYVEAELIAVKDGYRPIGECLWQS